MDNNLTNIIIINGAPGVGKSTVGSLLFSSLNNSAFLDGDDVWRINPFEVTDVTREIVEQNITFVLGNYIKSNYKHVILTWVLHRQSIIDSLLKGLKDLNFKLYIFTLICNEELLLERCRRIGKTASALEIARDRLQESLSLLTEKFDSGILKPDEIVNKIIEAAGLK